jgi:putative transcriptional regulator
MWFRARARAAFGAGSSDVKNRLNVLRSERRWSQADLATKLGVSRQTINSIETEKYEASLSLAFRIAALFGLRIEDIFFPADDEK